MSAEDIPQVVAYLANEEGSEDERGLQVIDAALKRDVSILPVVEAQGTEDIAGKMPVRIAHLNAASWSGQDANGAGEFEAECRRRRLPGAGSALRVRLAR